jgi:hypothetical protein
MDLLTFVTTNETTTKAVARRTCSQWTVFCFPMRSNQHTHKMKQCQHKLGFSTESVEQLTTSETNRVTVQWSKETFCNFIKQDKCMEQRSQDFQERARFKTIAHRQGTIRCQTETRWRQFHHSWRFALSCEYKWGKEPQINCVGRPSP